MYSDLHEKNSSQMPLNNAHLLLNHHEKCKGSLLAMRQSKHGNSLIIAAFHSANKPLFSFQEVKSLSNDMWFPIPKEVLPSGEVKVHRNEMICPTPNS